MLWSTLSNISPALGNITQPTSIVDLWVKVITSETGGWGHHYSVAVPTYNKIKQTSGVHVVGFFIKPRKINVVAGVSAKNESVHTIQNVCNGVQKKATLDMTVFRSLMLPVSPLNTRGQGVN